MSRSDERGLYDDSIGQSVNASTVATKTGVSRDEITRAGLALDKAGLVDVEGSFQARVMAFGALSAQSRTLAASWRPSRLSPTFAALEAIAKNPNDEDTRTRQLARSERESARGRRRARDDDPPPM